MKMFSAAVALMATLGLASVADAMPNDPDTTPGAPPFCKTYASKTANVVAKALKRNASCLDYGKGMHSDYRMHYDWCLRTPRTEVEGAAEHIRDLSNRCVAAAVAPPARQAGNGKLKWVGPWVWIHPLTLFGRPVDTKGQRLSIELLDNNRVNLCVDLRSPKTSCSVVGYLQSNGIYTISNGSGLYEIRATPEGLTGQFWWRKENRARTGPDGTFALKVL